MPPRFLHNPCRRWMKAIGVIMTLAPALLAPAQSEITAANLTDEHVRKATTALIESLYAQKHADRLWEPEKVPAGDSTRQRGGYTALVALALLTAGESYQDPRLRDAIEYLERFSMEGTYALCMRTQVWTRLPPKFQERLAADTQWLLDGFSEASGGWDYVQDSRSRRKDNSIRQFGALALWEAAKRGAKVESRFWQRLEDAFLDLQLADGGWNYQGEGPATGSMTAAGLATLFITQDFLHARDAAKAGSERTARHQTAIDKGLQWMDENFSPSENPGKNTWFYYYLYGVERVGLASGYKTFGTHDWFRQGAAELLNRLLTWNEQAQSFTVNQNTYGDGRKAKIRTDDLAFALMFLARGRVAVAINKLQFEGSWNNRPRDVANLVNWIRESSETDLNWQIVKITDSPETWLDAPLLYVASHQPLPFMKDLTAGVDEYVQKSREITGKRIRGEEVSDAEGPPKPKSPELEAIRRYLDLGGTMLAIAEGGGRPFAQTVEQAGRLMYPDLDWRELPDSHWAYGILHPVKSRRVPLRALSNGVRDLIILAPSGDVAAALQTTNIEKKEADFQTLANLYLYASEMNRPRPRLDRHVDATSVAPVASLQRAGIVRAMHQGQWRAEPASLEVFANWMREARGMDLVISEAPLQSIATLQPRPTLVLVSGTERIEFTEAEQQAIRTYIEAGGFVLFETAGGEGAHSSAATKPANDTAPARSQPAFARGAEELCAELFQRPVESISRSRVISGDGLERAANCQRVEYRPFALQVFGARETAPRLQGIALNPDGQPQIIFSREDLSHGLLNQPCWGIAGYAPNSARDLLANIVQHAIAGVK